MKVLIKNGYIVDPKSNREGRYDIIAEDGVITRVLEGGVDEVLDTFDKEIDAEGLYVMPGFIDLHVHLREPGFEYKETISTGAAAAAHGGFTSICPMPNTKPATDSIEMIKFIIDKAKQEAVVHVLPVGAVTKGQEGKELADIIGMAKAGAVAISEDGKSVMDTAVYLEGMKLAKEAGIPVLAHCEDKTLVGKGVINAGLKDKEFGVPGISNAVEDVIVARDIIMAKEAGCRLHLCHCSTEDSVKLVKLAKEDGLDVTAEVCPHHFTLTDADIKTDDARYKMNPPLRKQSDVDMLKYGLYNGIMDVISTDHAPHGEEEKSKGFANSPFGIVGLETAFPLSYTTLVLNGELTLSQLVEKMSVNPAAVLGIKKGCIDEGYAADIVIADIDNEYTIDINTFASKGRNTPYDGWKVKGNIKYTLVDGNVVYEG